MTSRYGNTPHYILKSGMVFYGDEGREKPARSNKIGFLFDLHEGILHKHGSAELVEPRFEEMKSALARAGFVDMAEDLVYMAIDISEENAEMLEEINAAIATMGRIKHLYNLLTDREIEAKLAPLLPMESFP